MYSEKAYHSIGMFDSGIGGLTVMRAVQEKLPHEQIVYFGDTARLPYGDKSVETILRYSIENAIFLMEHSIKVLVIACNTASSAAASKLGKIFNIPVVGVIEPGARRAAEISKSGKIAVLGTWATIQSKAYEVEIKKILPSANVVSIACPLFVPFIEEGLHSHAAMDLIIEEYLHPLKDQHVDTLLLGCTHYPTLKNLIQDYMGEGVQIVDSASTCAEEVEKILTSQRLHRPGQEQISHRYFVSDNPEKFRRLGQQFIREKLPEIHLHSASSVFLR